MNRCFFILALCACCLAGAYAQGWISQTSPLGSHGLGRIQFVSSTEGWISASNGQLLHTTNSGATWSVVTASGNDTVAVLTDPSRAMSFGNSTTGWLIGSLGSFDAPNGAVLYNTTNGGTTWSRQLLASWSMGLIVQFVDANNGWALVGNGGFNSITSAALMHTTNGGATWSQTLNALGIPYFVDAYNGWAIGSGSVR